MTAQEMMIRMLVQSLLLWTASTVKNAASKKRMESIFFEAYSVIILLFPNFGNQNMAAVKRAATKAKAKVEA